MTTKERFATLQEQAKKGKDLYDIDININIMDDRKDDYASEADFEKEVMLGEENADEEIYEITISGFTWSNYLTSTEAAADIAGILNLAKLMRPFSTSRITVNELQAPNKTVLNAIDRLNIRWSTEDLEGALSDQGIKPSVENLTKLAGEINNGFIQTLIAETNERLAVLVQQCFS